MPQVTTIQQQVKNPNRYNIFIDDKFSFGIDEDALIQLSIKKGQEVDEKQLAEFLQKSELSKLYQKVLRFLEVRPRSEKEVKDYLWRPPSLKLRWAGKIKQPRPLGSRGGGLEPKDPIGETESLGSDAAIVERLKKENYLNDPAFARWWVEQRSLSSKPRGDRLIKLELRQKGISEEVIKEVLEAAKIESANQDGPARQASQLAGVAGGEVETPLQKLIKKQWPKYRLLPFFEAKNKLVRYLLNRGFDYQEIKAALSKDGLSS